MNAIWIVIVVFLLFIALETGISYWITLEKIEFSDEEQERTNEQG